MRWLPALLLSTLIISCASLPQPTHPCPSVQEVRAGGSYGPYTLPDPANLTWNEVALHCSNGARFGVGVLTGEDLIRDEHRVEPRVFWSVPLWQRPVAVEDR